MLRKIFSSSLHCLALWIFLTIHGVAACSAIAPPLRGLPLFYWNEQWHGRYFVNFGDYLSLIIVERIIGEPITVYKKSIHNLQKKLLAVGSILYFARDNDVIWGAGISGKQLNRKDYKFSNLDVRAVRGPLSRAFLMNTFHINCPEVYGDPALLFPYLFPEFKRKKNPSCNYIIIPHYSEEHLFPKDEWENVVYSTDPWDYVIRRILDSRFVISSSLHGLILADAYGIPSRMLRISEEEPFFKYQDYYLGTNRPHFRFATSVEEAFEMGGEAPFQCDLKKLYEAFPFDYWKGANFAQLINLPME